MRLGQEGYGALDIFYVIIQVIKIKPELGGGILSKIKKEKISAKGFDIEVYTEDFKNDYISLTDIAKYKNKEEPNVVVSNWMRNYNTIEYLGIWEQLNNPDFNPLEFEGYLKEAGSDMHPQTRTK